jgi:hypothetical protein
MGPWVVRQGPRRSRSLGWRSPQADGPARRHRAYSGLIQSSERGDQKGTAAANSAGLAGTTRFRRRSSHAGHAASLLSNPSVIAVHSPHCAPAQPLSCGIAKLSIPRFAFLGVISRYTARVAPSAFFALISRSRVSACVLACVGAGGRTDETPEVPVQLALIVEPDSLRDFARLHACRQELLRAHDAQPREVGMRW